MSAASIAKALGGHPCGAGGYLVRCPVRSHGRGGGDRRPSLSIRDGDRAFLVRCHAGCDARDVLDELRRRGILDDDSGGRREHPRRLEAQIQATRASAIASAVSIDKQRTTRTLVLWNEAGAPTGTIVEEYLASRGLHLPHEVVEADAIRFHSRCPFGLADRTTTRLPAMLALMRNVITDSPQALHRTALKPDGSGKAEMPDGSSSKKMLGHAKGACIKLVDNEEVTHGIFITEGIETGIAALCAGFKPTWACGSAGALAAVPTLAGIEAFTVIADADPTGLAAATACAERWFDAGCEARIVESTMAGEDLNDIFRRAG
jgi:putative DNA primase/helicase